MVPVGYIGTLSKNLSMKMVRSSTKVDHCVCKWFERYILWTLGRCKYNTPTQLCIAEFQYSGTTWADNEYLVKTCNN